MVREHHQLRRRRRRNRQVRSDGDCRCDGGNGGSFAFEPAAVRVDPETTVIWKWSGEGGSHNVAVEDGSFGSEMTGDAGHTLEQTFEADGVAKYACVLHEPMGMKGAVVVGDVGREAQPDCVSAEPLARDGRRRRERPARGALTARVRRVPVRSAQWKVRRRGRATRRTRARTG
ncbi:halocyanin domain-containing protein [Halorussus sp. GCM10023401]|uniref:halocyanin domain-containing protein n=1 Tax=Halorussus sp. GCM10023401 TaxID=3252680 RepID=UPI003613B97D